MDPITFLDVAAQLQSSLSEAERRTAIGRSYYALYNVLRSTLEAQAVPFTQGVDDHRRLTEYLFRCRHRAAARIGATLRDLRILRNEADYEMGITVTRQQSQFAYAQARQAVDRFKALTSTDMQTIIARIKAIP